MEEKVKKEKSKVGGILTGQSDVMWEELNKPFAGFENDGRQTSKGI